MENEIFNERIVKSNLFNKEEKKEIQKNYLLYKKCYYLGIIDKEVSSSNYFF